MFIVFALFTIGLITLVALRDWMHYTRQSAKSIQKSLKRISQLISLQEWDKAQKELSPLLESGKGGKEGALCEIQLLRGMGKPEEALNRLEQANHIYPEELLFRLEEGQILLELGKYGEAAQAFQVCSPILRAETDLLSFANALYRSGDPEQCLEVIFPLLERTQNGSVIALAGDAYYDLKDFEHAIHLYTHALDLGMASHHVYIQLGHAYRRSNQLHEAEKIFRGLLEKDAGDVTALLGVGTCLQERGLHTKAFLVYQTGLSWSRDLRLLNKAAYAALRTQRYSQAESYFLEATQRQEPDPQTLAYYGMSLELQKKWLDAEHVYLKLIQTFPTSPYGYRGLAWLFGVGLSQTVSPEDGLELGYKTLKLQSDPLSWEILSACAARTGHFEKAYQIQLSLAKQDTDPQVRGRRQQSLRALRKRTPLSESLVPRSPI